MAAGRDGARNWYRRDILRKEHQKEEIVDREGRTGIV